MASTPQIVDHRILVRRDIPGGATFWIPGIEGLYPRQFGISVWTAWAGKTQTHLVQVRILECLHVSSMEQGQLNTTKVT